MKSGLVSSVAALFIMAGTANAALTNGGFETGDLTGWQVLGDASVQTSSFGSGPTQGLYQAVLTNDRVAFENDIHLPKGDDNIFGRVYPFSGSPAVGVSDSFLGLPALGEPDGNLRAITRDPDGAPFPQFHPGIGPGSAITQEFFGQSGTLVSFNWNYVTNDGYAYDYSFVSLTSANFVLLEKLAGNGDRALPSPLVASNTPFMTETGFQTFSFQLPATGTYTLGMGVMAVRDSLYDSGLIIDSVKVPEPSSLLLLTVGIAGLEWWRRKRAA